AALGADASPADRAPLQRLVRLAACVVEPAGVEHVTRIQEAGRDAGNGHDDLRNALVARRSRRRAGREWIVARVEVVLSRLGQDGRPVSRDGELAPELEHGAGALEIDADVVDGQRGAGGVVQTDGAGVEA